MLCQGGAPYTPSTVPNIHLAPALILCTCLNCCVLMVRTDAVRTPRDPVCPFQCMATLDKQPHTPQPHTPQPHTPQPHTPQPHPTAMRSALSFFFFFLAPSASCQKAVQFDAGCSAEHDAAHTVLAMCTRVRYPSQIEHSIYRARSSASSSLDSPPSGLASGSAASASSSSSSSSASPSHTKVSLLVSTHLPEKRSRCWLR